jgi:hypothetical protein
MACAALERVEARLLCTVGTDMADILERASQPQHRKGRLRLCRPNSLFGMSLRTRVQFVRGPSCTAYKPLLDLPAWASWSLTDANLLDEASFRSIMHRITARRRGSGPQATANIDVLISSLTPLLTASHIILHTAMLISIRLLPSFLALVQVIAERLDYQNGTYAASDLIRRHARTILSSSRSFVYAQNNCGLRTSNGCRPSNRASDTGPYRLERLERH